MTVMILGVGNILRSDDGFGIYVVQRLQREYDFAKRVVILDGHILGLNLMPLVVESDGLMIVDTMVTNGRPGDIYRLEGESILLNGDKRRHSVHQLKLQDMLGICRVLFGLPPTVIFGIEPFSLDVGAHLTPFIAGRVDKMIGMLLGELEAMKIDWKPKDPTLCVLPFRQK